MRSFKDSLILIVIIFSSLFLANTAFMYAVFGINAIRPVERQATVKEAVASNAGDSSAARNGSRSIGTGGAYGDGGGQISSPQGADTASATGASSASGTSSTPGAASASGSTGVLAADTGVYMTAGEVQSLGELGLGDKLAAVTILSQLGSELSDKIYDIASDGVTNSEMDEIKSMLESKLSKTDMDTLYAILGKSRKLYAEKNGK